MMNIQKNFGYIINGTFDKISREDVLFFIRYKEFLELCKDEPDISVSSRNKDGVLIEHNLDTIIKKK